MRQVSKPVRCAGSGFLRQPEGALDVRLVICRRSVAVFDSCWESWWFPRCYYMPGVLGGLFRRGFELVIDSW